MMSAIWAASGRLNVEELLYSHHQNAVKAGTIMFNCLLIKYQHAILYTDWFTWLSKAVYPKIEMSITKMEILSITRLQIYVCLVIGIILRLDMIANAKPARQVQNILEYQNILQMALIIFEYSIVASTLLISDASTSPASFPIWSNQARYHPILSGAIRKNNKTRWPSLTLP